MSRLALAATMPDGGPWLEEDAIVLADRELVDGTDPAALSRFSDTRWHLDAAVFEANTRAMSVNFAGVPMSLRVTAKHYFWHLINTDCPRQIRRVKVTRYSIRTIVQSVTSVVEFFTWLDRRGTTELSQVTAEMLDEYLLSIITSENSDDVKSRRVVEVRRLWSYSEALPAPMRLAILPWHGASTQELLGRTIGNRSNSTPRIAEKTMQSLLTWSLRFVEDFADDIVAAHTEFQFLQSRTTWARKADGVTDPSPKSAVQRALVDYLDHLRRSGRSLPGRIGADGTIEIDWSHLARVVRSRSHSLKRPGYARLVLESGLPVADNAYLETPITGRLHGLPWLDDSIAHFDAAWLARHLTTACIVVIAYLSGARPGEVLDLRRGCVEHDRDLGLWLMAGTYFKNAVDDNGNKIPAGAARRDPWVVVEPVARAVAVLERLHDQPFLFPRTLDPRRRDNKRRTGDARTTQSITDDLAAFVEWVNTYCADRHIAGIPADPRAALKMSRFRRTLAWFIRRRPRGLVAGALQYGHVGTRLFQGYAGTYDSGFPDEYAFEDFLARLEELGEDQRRLDAGEHVSGPAADAYRIRVTAAHKQFGGHVLTSTKQARDLVGNPLLQIFPGKAMTCVFDPAHALCQLRGVVDDPMVTPDTDDCRPRCLNIARTDRDIAEIRSRRHELADIVADPLAPPIRHQREQHELDRLDTILENHQ